MCEYPRRDNESPNNPESRDSEQLNDGIIKNTTPPCDPATKNCETSQPIYRTKEPFEADRPDRLFALFAFVLGFFFVRWVLFFWQGWGVTAFTAGFCTALILYMIKKGMRIPYAGWFWLSAIMLIGISYSFYSNNGLEPWRSLFLFCAAIYSVLCAAGQLIDGKTSNRILLDGINGMFVIPFRNFGSQYKSLASFGFKKKFKGKYVLSIVLGLLLALLVIGMVLPLLLKADSGGFAKIADRIYDAFVWIQEKIIVDLQSFILAIPVAAYLFALIAGSVHKRGTQVIKKDAVSHLTESVKILSPATVYTLLSLVCLVYLVFIGSQLPYYFSAFGGKIPEGMQIYSAYARSGFFELCQIAVINLSLLTAANLFIKKQTSKDPAALKALNCILSLLTLLLIATAFSKMVLYITVYGLSIRRLLPCLFMVFLAVVFCGIIALQKWQFSIMRLSAFTGALMLCALCLLNPDGFVARYNADRYLSGTLADFDIQILYQTGEAGIDPALKVYTKTKDEGLKADIKTYIDEMRQKLGVSGNLHDDLQRVNARQKITEFNWAD